MSSIIFPIESEFNKETDCLGGHESENVPNGQSIELLKERNWHAHWIDGVNKY